MKLVGVVAILLGGAFVVGCNGGGVQAKAPANRDIAELLQEELSHTIGTTSIASAEIPRAKDPTPLRVDDEPSSPAAQTWGATQGESSSDHDTAASDLAANPYTTADAPRDIYDPR